MSLQVIRRRLEQLTPPPPPPARLIVFARCAIGDESVTGIEAYGYEVKRLVGESLKSMEARLVATMPTDNPWVVASYQYADDKASDEVVRSCDTHRRP